MARFCNHSGCQSAIAKRRLVGKTCPECGYALLSRQTPLRYIGLSALFSLLFLMLVRMCVPEHQVAENPKPPPLRHRPNTNDQQESTASALPSKPLPQSKAQPGVDVRGTAQGLADTVKLSQGQSAAFLAAALSRRGTPTEIKDLKLLAAVIYRWVATNISYDVESLNPRARAPQDPDRVLRDRKAVCEGYACLSEFLLSQNNIECRIVHGIARTDATKIGSLPSVETDGHAWLIVKWESRWHILEPTWGSGAINARKFEQSFTWDWFDADPEIAIYSHIPEEPWMQLLENPLSTAEIGKSALVQFRFFRAIEVSPQPLMPGNLIRGAHSSALKFKPRHGFKFTAEVVSERNPLSEKHQAKSFIIPSGDCELTFPSLPPGEYTLNVFADDSNSGKFEYCASFRLQQTALSPKQYPPLTFTAYNDVGAQLIEPLTRDLPSGLWQRFALQAHPDLSLALQFEGESTWHYLSETKGTYEGKMFLRPGKLRLWRISGKNMTPMVEFVTK